jgi:cell division protein FtsI (penicillin-binding protein 3)
MKIVFIGLMFVGFWCAVAFRSYQLQIIGSAKLNRLAKIQYRAEVTVNPKRGAIYDRHGNVLALDVLVASIALNPNSIVDHDKVKKVLTKYLDVTELELEKKFASKRKFEWIVRRVAAEKGDEIKKERIKGVQVLKEYRRFYPNKGLAGQLLGAVGYDAKALGGLELYYDEYLRSAPEKKHAERDARGKLIAPLDEIDGAKDVYLSLDKNIQHFTEKYLFENAKKHGVKSGFAIVLDASTSEVLAMANYPVFNPNAYWEYEQSFWNNHAVISVYEPGSTFKAVLMAAALNSNKVTPKDKFFCENGRYQIGNNIIGDHHPHGWLTAHEILQVSSNVGVTKIAEKIGREYFYDFIATLGFGQKLGIGFVGESRGYVKPAKTWKDIELSNIAFGQGLSVNGIQMAGAYAALVNGGLWNRPSLLMQVLNDHGKVVSRSEQKVKEVITEKTSEQIRKMLFSVTQTGGTAMSAHLEGYLAGGKTGTAQKFDPKLKAYAEDDYVSSFIGFAPLIDPKVIVYVVYESPSKNGYYGGVVAAPVFKSIAAESLAYMGIVPTGKNKKQLVHSVQPAEVVNQYVEWQQKRVEKARLTLTQKTMPDLRGLTLRKIISLTNEHKIKLKIEGSGVVVKQVPSPGEKLVDGVIRVKLATRS